MSSSTDRVAALRRQRRSQGMKQTTIWLTQEAEQQISLIVESMGLKSRSEAVQYALSRISNSESQMTN